MNRTFAIFLGAVVLAGPRLAAHHGYAAFFKPADRTVRIEGTLEELRWANPHVIMLIRADDQTLYSVTWQGASWVETVTHVTSKSFKAGDHISVIAAPARDPASHMLALVREVQLDSGWKWRSQGVFAEPDR